MNIDLFPGFSERCFEVDGNYLFARIGGEETAPPLLLLHGFPQSHIEWHPIASELAQTCRVVALDMKGHGRSSTPSGDAGHRTYSKAVWAEEAAKVMSILGHNEFSVVGHDRGAQVAYKLALDYPNRIEKLGVLDNLPIFKVWEMIKEAPGALEHWTWMAEPAPLPERRMTAAYIEEMCIGVSGSDSLDFFGAEALKKFREDWNDPAHVHAYCEDFRAGAGVDLVTDLSDLAQGKRIWCPTLVLWSKKVFGTGAVSPLDIWRQTFAPQAFGVEVEQGGHFVVEENPQATLEGIRRLLAK